jgi:hypothetical protein
MVVEVRGTAGQEDGKPLLAPYYGHEHRSGPDFLRTAPKVAVARSERLDGPGLGKARAQPDFLR